VIDNMAARRAAATIAKPLPGRGAENNTGRIMYATVSAGV